MSKGEKERSIDSVVVIGIEEWNGMKKRQWKENRSTKEEKKIKQKPNRRRNKKKVRMKRNLIINKVKLFLYNIFS